MFLSSVHADSCIDSHEGASGTRSWSKQAVSYRAGLRVLVGLLQPGGDLEAARCDAERWFPSPVGEALVCATSVLAQGCGIFFGMLPSSLVAVVRSIG